VKEVREYWQKGSGKTKAGKQRGKRRSSEVEEETSESKIRKLVLMVQRKKDFPLRKRTDGRREKGLLNLWSMRFEGMSAARRGSRGSRREFSGGAGGRG